MDYHEAKALTVWIRKDLMINAVRCDICGRPVAEPDGHHAIVSKQDVRGWPKEQRALINEPWNLLLVHGPGGQRCHKVAHANPKLCVAILVGIYTWLMIDLWVDRDLPFKERFDWHRGIADAEEAAEIVREWRKK
jgi:hypothetical protein